VVAEVVVVDATVVDDADEAVDGLVAGAVLEDGDADELHAAKSIAAPMAATNPTTPRRTFGCALIIPLDRTGAFCMHLNLLRGVMTTGCSFSPPEDGEGGVPPQAVGWRRNSPGTRSALRWRRGGGPAVRRGGRPVARHRRAPPRPRWHVLVSPPRTGRPRTPASRSGRWLLPLPARRTRGRAEWSSGAAPPPSCRRHPGPTRRSRGRRRG